MNSPISKTLAIKVSTIAAAIYLAISPAFAADIIGKFPTLKESDGARTNDAGIVWLGELSDKENNSKQVDLDNDDGVVAEFKSCAKSPVTFLVNVKKPGKTVGTAYLNLFADWNRDGEWKGSDTCADEWALKNYEINISEQTDEIHPYTISVPAGKNVKEIWYRAVISLDQEMVQEDGGGELSIGEVEDYGPLSLAQIAAKDKKMGRQPPVVPFGATCKPIFINHRSSGMISVVAVPGSDPIGSTDFLPKIAARDGIVQKLNSPNLKNTFLFTAITDPPIRVQIVHVPIEVIFEHGSKKILDCVVVVEHDGDGVIAQPVPQPVPQTPPDEVVLPKPNPLIELWKKVKDKVVDLGGSVGGVVKKVGEGLSGPFDPLVDFIKDIGKKVLNPQIVFLPAAPVTPTLNVFNTPPALRFFFPAQPQEVDPYSAECVPDKLSIYHSQAGFFGAVVTGSAQPTAVSIPNDAVAARTDRVLALDSKDFDNDPGTQFIYIPAQDPPVRTESGAVEVVVDFADGHRTSLDCPISVTHDNPPPTETPSYNADLDKFVTLKPPAGQQVLSTVVPRISTIDSIWRSIGQTLILATEKLTYTPGGGQVEPGGAFFEPAPKNQKDDEIEASCNVNYPPDETTIPHGVAHDLSISLFDNDQTNDFTVLGDKVKVIETDNAGNTHLITSPEKYKYYPEGPMIVVTVGTNPKDARPKALHKEPRFYTYKIEFAQGVKGKSRFTAVREVECNFMVLHDILPEEPTTPTGGKPGDDKSGGPKNIVPPPADDTQTLNVWQRIIGLIQPFWNPPLPSSGEPTTPTKEGKPTKQPSYSTYCTPSQQTISHGKSATIDVVTNNPNFYNSSLTPGGLIVPPGGFGQIIEGPDEKISPTGSYPYTKYTYTSLLVHDADPRVDHVTIPIYVGFSNPGTNRISTTKVSCDIFVVHSGTAPLPQGFFEDVLYTPDSKAVGPTETLKNLWNSIVDTVREGDLYYVQRFFKSIGEPIVGETKSVATKIGENISGIPSFISRVINRGVLCLADPGGACDDADATGDISVSVSEPFPVHYWGTSRLRNLILGSGQPVPQSEIAVGPDDIILPPQHIFYKAVEIVLPVPENILVLPAPTRFFDQLGGITGGFNFLSERLTDLSNQLKSLQEKPNQVIVAVPEQPALFTKVTKDVINSSNQFEVEVTCVQFSGCGAEIRYLSKNGNLISKESIPLSGQKTLVRTMPESAAIADIRVFGGGQSFSAIAHALKGGQPIISIASPTITTSSLSNGTQNSAYSGTIAASGGVTPYTWSISSGALPTGISINASTGALSGTPTTAETANFTVQALAADGQAATKALTLTIDAAADPLTLTAPTAAYFAATQCLQTCANFAAASASGGTAPYTYSIVGGSRNACSTANNFAITAGGTMSGNNSGGNCNGGTATIRVTDANLDTADGTFNNITFINF